MSFLNYVDNIITIHSAFSRHFAENALVPWQPAQFGEYPAIDVSNRYFTPKRDAQLSTSITMSEDIDPNHALTILLGNDFVHTSDNVVEYFERIKDGGLHRCVNGIK
jgi:hypothetical protein